MTVYTNHLKMKVDIISQVVSLVANVNYFVVRSLTISKETVTKIIQSSAATGQCWVLIRADN